MTYDLQPVSFTRPSSGRPSLTITFRLPSGTGTNPIHPATGLQLSFANKDHEPFLERLTPRDVETLGEGEEAAEAGTLCTVTVAAAQMPRFPDGDADTEVRLHAWRGERWLGTWAVGTVSGL